MLRMKTVSYTHLDVYKRQILSRCYKINQREKKTLQVKYKEDKGLITDRWKLKSTKKHQKTLARDCLQYARNVNITPKYFHYHHTHLSLIHI